MTFSKKKCFHKSRIWKLFITVGAIANLNCEFPSIVRNSVPLPNIYPDIGGTDIWASISTTMRSCDDPIRFSRQGIIFGHDRSAAQGAVEVKFHDPVVGALNGHQTAYDLITLIIDSIPSISLIRFSVGVSKPLKWSCWVRTHLNGWFNKFSTIL